jgi:hypothetical protein
MRDFDSSAPAGFHAGLSQLVLLGALAAVIVGSLGAIIIRIIRRGSAR